MEKLTENRHFCRDTGRVSRGHPAGVRPSRVFSDISCECFTFSCVPFLLPISSAACGESSRAKVLISIRMPRLRRMAGRRHPGKGFISETGQEQILKNSPNPREKWHININFLLWLTSRWPWDKRLVVPGLTGPKSLCFRLKAQEI